MEENELYSLIKKVADENIKEGKTISRADLAYVIRKEMHTECEDNAKFNQLIYNAYIKLGQPESIRKAITTNDGTESIVDQYKLNDQLNTFNIETSFEIIKNDADRALNSIEEATKSVSDVLKIELAKNATDVYSWLQGTSGISTIKEKSSTLMQNYAKMIDSYTNAKNGVRTDIHDFVQLRSSINSQYMRFATSLIDIFGDGVKVINPELFDFDSIEWIDVSSLKKDKELEFYKLDEKCTLLLGEIVNSFSSTIENVPTWIKAATKLGNKSGIYGSLAITVIDYLNHWMDAKSKTTLMKDEYIRFESSIIKDRTQIKADIMRLSTIHKVINDIYIPKADAFARLSGRVLTSDLEKLLDSIYNSPEIKPLKEERDKLIKELSLLQSNISDHTENISLFDSQIEEWQGMIDAQKNRYEEAKGKKPHKPSTLLKLLTLGHAQKEYESSITDWQSIDGKLVNEYENTLVELTKSKEDKTSHSVQIEKDKQEYARLKGKLKEITRQITQKIDCSQQQKEEVLSHLKNIISLLNVAKNIMNSGLDESLTKTTSLQDEDITILPHYMEKDVNDFIQNVKTQLIKEEKETVRKHISDIVGDLAEEKTEQAAKNLSNLIDSYIHLQSDQMKAQLSREVYAKEIEQLKNKFTEVIKNADNQSEILRETIKKANLAEDNESLRKAIIELGEGTECELTMSDLEAMIRGEKSIEI